MIMKSHIENKIFEICLIRPILNHSTLNTIKSLLNLFIETYLTNHLRLYTFISY